MSRLVRFGVPVLLALVLIGCGKKPAEVAQNEPQAPAELKNEDPGLDAKLPDIDRLDKATVDNKVTGAPLYDPAALPGLPPVLALPSPAPGDSALMGGQVFAGRVSGTKFKLYQNAGGLAPMGPMGMGPGGAKAGDGAPAKADQQTGYNAMNAEAYGVYRENEFRSPRVAALSTFSADVNTAAYANVRRILKEGKLPPANAVFLAEFVNYFRYDYAQPKGDDPIAFHMEMGPCPWNRNHHLLRVGVQAREIANDKLPPRNLVFLVDTSGSMHQANRLPLVQQ